jgi:outer membrane protein OmpA-like peptidoglycan-associated protein
LSLRTAELRVLTLHTNPVHARTLSVVDDDMRRDKNQITATKDAGVRDAGTHWFRPSLEYPWRHAMSGFDKVGKPTGAGEGGFLVTDQDLQGNVIFEFILDNYNIDGNLLKPEHKVLLDRHIVSFLKGNKAHAELTGTASRTGAADYNRQLSRERVERVRQFLLRRGLTDAQVPAKDMKAVGEDKSTSKFDEDELERSVRIRIVVGVRQIPEHPKIVVPQVITPQNPNPPPATQTLPETVIVVDNRVPWAIQEISGVNVGASFGGGGFGLGAGVQAGTIEYHFLLVNQRTREMAQCRYFGAGGGGGVGPGGLKPSLGPSVSFSLTQASHIWDVFRTKGGTSFGDFEGAATWFEASVGLGTSTGVARIKFSRLGITVPVSTGRTIGTPGSFISAGDFHLRAPVQLQL